VGGTAPLEGEVQIAGSKRSLCLLGWVLSLFIRYSWLLQPVVPSRRDLVQDQVEREETLFYPQVLQKLQESRHMTHISFFHTGPSPYLVKHNYAILGKTHDP